MADDAPREPRSTHERANGLSHHVLTWNDAGAPTVVLCHGFLDQAHSWGGVAERLAAAGARAVAFSWRGHGHTDHVGPGGYYHFMDYTLDLHELMPKLAREPVHLVGHSMGGAACVTYAATHPAQVRTLTVIEGLGPPATAAAEVDKVQAWLASVDRLRAKAPRPIEDLADAVRRLRAAHHELPVELAYTLAERGTRPRAGGGLEWRYDPLHRTTSPRPFSAERFRSFLRRVEAPTLVVTGGRGFKTDDHAARRAALREWREETIDDVGHMIHWLRPERLAQLILSHAGS